MPDDHDHRTKTRRPGRVLQPKRIANQPPETEEPKQRFGSECIALLCVNSVTHVIHYYQQLIISCISSSTFLSL